MVLSLVVIARTSLTRFGCVMCKTAGPPSLSSSLPRKSNPLNSECDLEATRLIMKLAAVFISEKNSRNFLFRKQTNIFVVSFSCHINYVRACCWRAKLRRARRRKSAENPHLLSSTRIGLQPILSVLEIPPRAHGVPRRLAL